MRRLLDLPAIQQISTPHTLPLLVLLLLPLFKYILGSVAVVVFTTVAVFFY
jgi:hypothetical protein